MLIFCENARSVVGVLVDAQTAIVATGERRAMIINPSDSVRFDKSRAYTFLVWEPGAPEAISISAWWNPALHGGTWHARRSDAEDNGAVGKTPFDAALYACVCHSIVIDEIATQAVIEREVEATRSERDAAMAERDKALDDLGAATSRCSGAIEAHGTETARCEFVAAERDLAVQRCNELTIELDQTRRGRSAAQAERDETIAEHDKSLCELVDVRAELHRARELTRKAEAELGSATREFARSMESMRAELSAMTRMRDEAGETLAIAVQEREGCDEERQRAIRSHDRLDLLILKILNAKSGDGPEINCERVNLLRELAVSAGYAATADGLTRIYTELDVLRADRETLKVHAAVADGSLANAKETIAAQTKTIEDQSDQINYLTIGNSNLRDLRDLVRKALGCGDDDGLVDCADRLRAMLSSAISERDAAVSRLKGMTESRARVLAERDTLYRMHTEAARDRADAIKERNEAIKERNAMTDARNAHGGGS
jgi:hypothetical protein